MNPPAPVLSVNQLAVSFGDAVAVKPLDFSMMQGKTLALVGESGSGKSVSSLAIMGLLDKSARIEGAAHLHFDQGEIELLNLSETDLQQVRGNKISMVFQEPMTSLNPVMRCGTQVTEVLLRHRKLSRSAARQKTLELFQEVELPHPEELYRRYPHEISGGQKQRVMIAMAVANAPTLLIADEPTTALDVTVQHKVLQLLKRLQMAYGMCVLFITHDLALVGDIADEVMVMYRGELVEQGPVRTVLNNPQHPYTRGLLACRPPASGRPTRLPVVADFTSGHTPRVEMESANERAERHSKIYAQLPLLKAVDVDKFYRSGSWPNKRVFHALKQINLSVYPGETLGLVGESGSGKSTLGRTLLRLLEPDSGEIWFGERNITRISASEMRKLRASLQLIFQDPFSSLNPTLTVAQALEEPLLVHRGMRNSTARRKEVLTLLDRVGLPSSAADRYPHQFSGGQRQRIGIARTLACQPQFIVCDESVSALDVSVQAQVLNLLNDLKAEFGFTYLFISHDLHVVRYMSDRVAVMRQGEIVELGHCDEVFSQPKHAYTQQLLESVPGRN